MHVCGPPPCSACALVVVRDFGVSKDGGLLREKVAGVGDDKIHELLFPGRYKL